MAIMEKALFAIRTFSNDLPDYPVLQSRLSQMRGFYVLEEGGEMKFANALFVYCGLKYDQSRDGDSLTEHYLAYSMTDPPFEHGGENDLRHCFEEVPQGSKEYDEWHNKLTARTGMYIDKLWGGPIRQLRIFVRKS